MVFAMFCKNVIEKCQIVVTLGPTTKSAFRVKRSSIFNTPETNYCFFRFVGEN